ncbi:MAG: hypothetical protein ACI92A_002713 [Candidatus Paceibacteria bacterium]|jgi:hypothetical protein
MCSSFFGLITACLANLKRAIQNWVDRTHLKINLQSKLNSKKGGAKMGVSPKDIHEMAAAYSKA